MRPLPLTFDQQVKASTGVAGLDEITGGGLPRGRTTLLIGGPGSGKTILALQFLAHGARQCAEPGIFVAFEEAADRIAENARSFGWGLDELRGQSLFLLDAQPEFDEVQSGTFELTGLLEGLAAKARTMGARRIVFDAIDVVLALLPDPADRRRELYRLHAWMLANGLTGIVTAKSGADEASGSGKVCIDFMQFMMDCGVILTHDVVRGISLRKLRVQKYRGSRFDENEAPFRIEKRGMAVAVARSASRTDVQVSNERLSSGVAGLDDMLGGGYIRATSVLISGLPGTAKTTLAAHFAHAACERGERVVFVSFESDGSELVRNMAAVGIPLGRYVDNGQLRIASARTLVGSGGSHLVRIREIVEEHQARCLVIDPVSILCKGSSELPARTVAELLIDWTKASDIDLVSTHLHEDAVADADGGGSLNISTLADTWIQLTYVVQGGANNRGLRVVKSRGSAHSNVMREVSLGDTGFVMAGYYGWESGGPKGAVEWSTHPWPPAGLPVAKRGNARAKLSAAAPTRRAAKRRTHEPAS